MTEHGKSRLTWFAFHIYDISLYLPKGREWSYEQPFALHITYKKNIKNQDFVDTSIEEMSRYHRLTAEDEKRYRRELARVFRDVKPEDTITAVFTPGEELSFFHNGQPTGQLYDMRFAKRFLDIWLHPDCHYAEMRRQLVTGKP